jgi:cytidylate kinase
MIGFLWLTGRVWGGYNSGMSHSEPRRLSVAIDGPAGAGKSTVARRVAEALGYTYVDTGAMYRAVAWAVRDREIDLSDTDAVAQVAEALEIELTPEGQVYADGRDITDDIRSPAISNLTSPLSALPRVRQRLVALQKKRAQRGGVVMEGRDIGTVVLPSAEVKVFLTASLDQRVQRRERELVGRGVALPREELHAQIAERDARDGSRDTAPMRPAPDAIILDSDRLSVDEVVTRILELHQEALHRAS